ncbi:MAG TPA: hypothetical protein VJN89_09135 [Candidatus Acidoferrum sp.]|nr:hypothetical protein [Candidatus Acidoferrum sp.]
MQCRDVEEVLEQEGLAPLPQAVRGHVASCRQCQGYIADLETIVSAAQELPAEVEPPSRVWVALRTQLELEGIIKEPAAAPKAEPISWWSGFGQLFRGRALATLTVGAVLAAAAVLQVRRSAPIVEPPSPPGIEAIAKQVNQQEVDLRNMHPASTASTSPVDAALEQNLKQIDSFIADCERHLKEAPGDELAQEYLADAYQQKAELLAAMMDRGRSVN